MSIEYFMIVTTEMWEKHPKIATEHFKYSLNKHYPDVAFDITAHYENNVFNPGTTVALLAKEIEQ